MSIDSIGYPLPVIVKGYACLNEAEMELARKNIDPARPRDGPGGRDAAAASAEVDPEKLAAAAKAASERDAPILSYAPGAIRTAAAEPGAVYSVEV